MSRNTLYPCVEKPREEYWLVTKQDVGREFGNPNWVMWAKQEIAALKAGGTQAASTNSRYMTALNVYEEYLNSEGSHNDWPTWLKSKELERLNG